MKDPWTWTKVRGLIMEVGGRLGGGGQRGRKWDNCYSMKNKKKNKPAIQPSIKKL